MHPRIREHLGVVSPGAARATRQHMTDLLHREITDRVLAVFYQVHRELGAGFLEKVYHRAMVIALREARLRVTEHIPIVVWFRGQLIGEFIADIVVEDVLLLEIKAVENIQGKHEAQAINYLRASDLELGFVLNFGPSPQFKRLLYTNGRKVRPSAEAAQPGSVRADDSKPQNRRAITEKRPNSSTTPATTSADLLPPE
jgi:GxxExxY protein